MCLCICVLGKNHKYLKLRGFKNILTGCYSKVMNFCYKAFELTCVCVS